jgi:hypothetical protein
MYSILKIAILSLLVISCGEQSAELSTDSSIPETGNSEILFQLKTADSSYLEYFPDGIIPWISLEDADKELFQLEKRHEFVLKERVVDIVIDYPVKNPVIIELKSNGKSGFTRAELALKISKEYKRIYREEEASANVKTIPLEEREGIINRNQTDGKYGIWGHDLGDLDLSAIVVHRVSGKKPRLELIVES